MKIFHGREQSAKSESRGPTFTGQVWADPVVMPTTEGVTINNVFFTPARAPSWHTHAQRADPAGDRRQGLDLCRQAEGRGDPGRRHRLDPGGRTALARRGRRQLPDAYGDLPRETDWQDEAVEADYTEATS